MEESSRPAGLPPNPDKRSWWQSGGKVTGWLLGLGAAFITALVTGLAGQVIGVVFSGDDPKKAETAVVPQRTEVRLMRPFTSAHRLSDDFKVTGRSEGSCQDGITSSDPSALVCAGKDHRLRDPCWRNYFGRSVACPRSPWDPEVWVYEQTNPVRFNRNPFATDLPWAMEVLDPRDEQVYRCLIIRGTSDVFAGMRVNWNCRTPDDTGEGDQAAAQALGKPRKSSGAAWTVHFSLATASDVRIVPVMKVWK